LARNTRTWRDTRKPPPSPTPTTDAVLRARIRLGDARFTFYGA
jgi:hypothetical protein